MFCTFHFRQMLYRFLTSMFNFYWSLTLQDFQKAGFFLQYLEIIFSKIWTFVSILCRSVWSSFSWRLWLLRTFFRENWVGSKVAGMKTILAFLTQPGSTSWPQKVQIRIFLNNILVKKDRNYIIINFVT